MIIVASDVHLGYDRCNHEAFSAFLDKCESAAVDRLVLLGDIIDFWRRNNAQITMDTRYGEIFRRLIHPKIKKVHYVVGNHDYLMLRLKERYDKNPAAVVYPYEICKSLRLEDGDSRFYFVHGYELEVLLNLEPIDVESYENFCDRMCFSNDITGAFASYLWDMINKHGSGRKIEELKKAPVERETIDNVRKFAESKGIFMLLGMKAGEKLVFGHTHKPFINEDRTIANTGSWVSEGKDDRPFNTYVKIEDGEMELREFEKDSFP